MTGIIVVYDRLKSIGFIEPDDTSITTDIFFHRTAVLAGTRPIEGLHVFYEIGEFRGRAVGINIRKVYDASAPVDGGVK